jgi:predicted  nucleic acid-binding Zn-ribbon protein
MVGFFYLRSDNSTYRSIKMAILQSEIDALQADFDNAKAKLEAAITQFNAEQPHLKALDEIIAFVDKVPSEFQAEFSAVVAKARNLI